MVTLISVPKLEGLIKTWVEDLVVDGKYRRKGIGEMLMKNVLEKAKKLRINSVTLTSRANRVAANALYKKLGFQIHETNYFKIDLN